MNRLSTAAACLLLTAAQAMPRSAGLGQPALPLPEGGAEIAVSPGVGFQAINGPPIPAGPNAFNVATSNTLAFPSAEANLGLGLSDRLGLNLHLSAAGLALGAKLAFPHSPLSVAVMPEVGLAFWSTGTSSVHQQAGANGQTDTGGTSAFEVVLGVRAIASHSSGLYAGAGYSFQQISTTQTGPGAGGKGKVDFSHGISAAVGYELGKGVLKIRPELALLGLPMVGGWNLAGAKSTWAGSGSEVFLFPNVTFAFAAAQPGQPTAAGMKPEELSRPPVFPAP